MEAQEHQPMGAFKPLNHRSHKQLDNLELDDSVRPRAWKKSQALIM